jgi:hypothetical protein
MQALTPMAVITSSAELTNCESQGERRNISRRVDFHERRGGGVESVLLTSNLASCNLVLQQLQHAFPPSHNGVAIARTLAQGEQRAPTQLCSTVVSCPDEPHVIIR